MVKHGSTDNGAIVLNARACVDKRSARRPCSVQQTAPILFMSLTNAVQLAVSVESQSLSFYLSYFSMSQNCHDRTLRDKITIKHLSV